MARTAKTTKTTKPVAGRRKPGRPPGSVAKTVATKVKARTVAKPAAAPRPPMVSKDALRAQVETLERANATLRAKSRESVKAAKMAAARIAELEDQVALLEKRLTGSKETGGGGQAGAAPKARRSPKRREIDPGDAVPPGVAVQNAEPMDLEAETALENLEDHLSGE